MFRKDPLARSKAGTLVSVTVLTAAITLTGCGTESADDLASIADFNLLDITAANTASTDSEDGSAEVRMMNVSWDSAVSDELSEAVTGVTYTVCQYDETQTDNCLSLGEVTDATEATVELGSLLEAVSASYFVMASYGDLSAATAEVSLDSETITDMIGYFKASNAQSLQFYGQALALSDDGLTMAVGAWGESSAASTINGDEVYSSDSEDSAYANYARFSGAVYLFSYYAGAWQQTAYIKASDSAASSYFGYSVDLSADGSKLAVGSWGAATGGAAYVYDLGEDEEWTETAILTASNTGSGDRFGQDVAISGDGLTIVIGANSEDSTYVTDSPSSDDDASGAGAAYVFSYASDSWTETAYLKASNAARLDDFGYAVDINYDGTVLVVGSYDETSVSTDAEDGTGDDSGAAYVFTYTDSSWSQTDFLKASNPGDGYEFGYSVSINNDGDRLAVGARYEDSAATGVNDTDIGQDDASADKAGAAYIFDADGDSWTQTAYVKASNTHSGANFAVHVALSGDGETLAIGANKEDSAATGINGDDAFDEDTETNYADQAGAVYLFTIDSDTWSQAAYIKASNTKASDTFGYRVALSSDGSVLAASATGEDSASTGINGDQISAAEVEADDVVVTVAVNYASGASAVYLY